MAVPTPRENITISNTTDSENEKLKIKALETKIEELEFANKNLKMKFLKVKIEELELENRILKEKLKEKETVKHNVVERKKPTINELIEEVEALSLNEEEELLYKPLVGLKKRDQKILIALSKYKGLNCEQIAEMFFGEFSTSLRYCYKYMEKLVQEGHVRVNKGLRPMKYFSRYKLGPSNDEGYVYIIKEFHNNTYKIGKARNIENRTRLFNVKLPFQWELITTIKFKDYSYGERLLHKLFNAKNIAGTEWFNLSEDDVKKIQQQRFPDEINEQICGCSS